MAIIVGLEAGIYSNLLRALVPHVLPPLRRAHLQIILCQNLYAIYQNLS